MLLSDETSLPLAETVVEVEVMSLSPDAVSPEAVVVSEDVVVAVESALFVVPVVPVLSEPPVPVSVETVVVVSENEVLPPADESEVAVVAPVVSVVDVVAVSVAVMSVETVVPDAVVPVGSVVPVTSLTLLPESEDVPVSPLMVVVDVDVVECVVESLLVPDVVLVELLKC